MGFERTFYHSYLPPVPINWFLMCHCDGVEFKMPHVAPTWSQCKKTHRINYKFQSFLGGEKKNKTMSDSKAVEKIPRPKQMRNFSITRLPWHVDSLLNLAGFFEKLCPGFNLPTQYCIRIWRACYLGWNQVDLSSRNGTHENENPFT